MSVEYCHGCGKYVDLDYHSDDGKYVTVNGRIEWFHYDCLDDEEQSNDA